jgi:hypothetical protein
MSVFSLETVSRSAPLAATHWTSDPRNLGQTLDLSESRTYDAALDSLGAYKLTGNFPVDLEIVLKDLRVLDKVAVEINPKTLLSDTRHVQFWSTDKVHLDKFAQIMRSVKSRIGADPERPWWVKLFQ